jgi:hypothetical protein
MTQRTSDIIDIGIRLLREFGFPCLVLAVLGWWGQLAAVALHRTVLVPVVESHTTFLETTSDTLRVLGSAQNRQAETLEEIAAGQREIHATIHRMEAEKRQP